MGTLVTLPASCSDSLVAQEEATARGVSLAGWQGWDRVTSPETRARLTALTSHSSQACEEDEEVEQEHVPAGMQQPHSQQMEDTQKPRAQGESL